MRTPLLTSTVLLLTVVAGCGDATVASTQTSTTPTVMEFEVSGAAHAGPVCPVEQVPPDPACADRPVEGALLKVIDESEIQVGMTSTSTDGSFVIRLPSGRYRLVPEPVEGLLGTAPPIEFVVEDGPVHNLDIAYDTGIR